jgi:hypothetical protein
VVHLEPFWVERRVPAGFILLYPVVFVTYDWRANLIT